jgi:hypothetical protein
MILGRLEFGIAIGRSSWGVYKGPCGCKFLDLGRLYFTWRDKDCKCQKCQKYDCKCPQDWKDE